MTVERDGRTREVSAALGEKPAEERRAERTPAGEEQGLGLTVQELDSALAAELGMRGERGVAVVAVEPGSPADEAGLQAGDVIKEVNRRQVTSVASFREALGAGADRRAALLLVRRGDDTAYVTVGVP